MTYGPSIAQLRREVPQHTEAVRKEVAAVRTVTARVLADPIALAAKLRKEINTVAQAKMNAVPKEKGSWRQVDEIEKERDIAIRRVDDVIRMIADGLKEGASEIFQTATKILETEGIDAALEFLQVTSPGILESAKRKSSQIQAEKGLLRRDLNLILLSAELLETKLEWAPATQSREQVAELAPDWFEARNSLGKLLLELARFPEAEPHLRAAAALGTNPEEQATGLNNLAWLLKETNRLAEAEPLMRRALDIDEQSYGAKHFRGAIDLNYLALLLMTTNRLAEAEPLMRRALAIDEQFYRAEHPNVAIELNNLAQLLQETNRQAEAEPLMRRPAVIFRKFGESTGHEHPHMQAAIRHYRKLLEAMKLSPDEIEAKLREVIAE